MKKLNLILVTIFLLAIANSTYAQQEGKRIRHTTLSIFNSSNNDLNIKLGLEVQSLKIFLIKSQEKWISPTYPLRSRPLFIIKTQEKEVRYTLKLNNSYMIFWNNKKKYWDIIKVNNKP